jgi:hypothetical protein
VVNVIASSLQSERYERGHLFQGPVVGPARMSVDSSRAVYEEAGLSPGDIDLVQVHDAFVIEELEYYELLGLCKTGDAEQCIERGDFELGGRCPVSTDGGLIARGHPGGPTGLATPGAPPAQRRDRTYRPVPHDGRRQRVRDSHPAARLSMTAPRAGAITVALLGLLTLPAGAEQSTIVATVNGTPITENMVNDVVKSLIANRSPAPSSDEIAMLSDAALDSLIDLELLYAAAQAHQIRVSDDEVNAEIARAKKRVGGDAAYAEALKRSGLSEAQIINDTRKTLMVDRFVEQRLMQDVQVTPEAMRRFYDEHQQEFQRDGKVIAFAEARPAVEQALRESERRQRQQAYLVELRKTANIARPTPAHQ